MLSQLSLTSQAGEHKRRKLQACLSDNATAPSLNSKKTISLPNEISLRGSPRLLSTGAVEIM